ncbi:MAG: hypothetical protein ACHREM_04740 [Polyangiales bacterium]
MNEPRTRRFFCCTNLPNGDRCGQPAPTFFYRPAGDAFDSPSPLCSAHALEFIAFGGPVEEWGQSRQRVRS